MVSSFFFCFLLCGGATAHPLGVAPEVRANYVVVGSNLRSVGLVLTLVCFQHLDAFRVAAFNRLLGKHRELKEQLAAKEEELHVAAGILVLFSSGGALAHPLGVAPEIRPNYVTVGPNLRSCLFLSFC